MHIMKNLGQPLLAILLGLAAFGANAQDGYPGRDVELVVPYSAGGSVDTMARAFAKEFSQLLGAPVLVQNRDGAGGTIGVSAVASARPDGYTVLFSPSSPLTQAPFLLGKVPFDTKDIQPVCQIFENPFVIAVRSESPLQSLEQLLAQAKARPGSVSYGHAGLGSVPHLATANLAKSAQVQFNEVPFRGDSQVIPQVLGGHVDFGALGASAVAGKNMRVLATLGNKRLDAFGDAPAVSEVGVAHAIIARNGLYVNRQVPESIKGKLESACRQATQSPAFLQAAQSQHQQVTYMDSASFAAQLAKDYAANRQLIDALGLLAAGQ